MNLIPKLEKMPLSPQNVFLDIQNPRFIGDRGAPACEDVPLDDPKTQERARLFLLRKHNARQLVESITQLGFLPLDHIVVREFAPNKYVVVEGNRRVAAIKTVLGDIRRRVLKPEKHIVDSLKNIEMYKMPASTENAERAALLFQGVRHISGVKSWGPYQQGRLAAELIKIENMSFTSAASAVGLSSSRVAALVRGYYGMKQFLEDDEFGNQADTSMFSFFEYAHAKPQIRNWLGWNDETNCYCNKETLRFFYQCIIPSKDSNASSLLSRHVRDYLPQVLEHEEAKQTFLDTVDIRAAYAVAVSDMQPYVKQLTQLSSTLKELESISISLRNEDIKLVEQLNQLTKQILQKHRP